MLRLALLRILAVLWSRAAWPLAELCDAARASGDAAGALRFAERFAVLRPRDPDAFTRVASLRLQQGDVAGAAEAFRRRQSLVGEGDRVINVYWDAPLDPGRAARGEAYVHALEDALVDTGYWTVLHRDRAYVRETYDREFAKSPLVGNRVSPDRKAYIVAHPRPTRVDEPCILLGGDENYAHWVMRSLLKLWLLEGDEASRRERLLVNEDLFSFQREYLELLGIGNERLLGVLRGTVVECPRLRVPTQMRGHARFADSVRWLCSKLAPALRDTSSPRPLVFLSRRDSGNRLLVNEAELESALAPLGFETVVPGELPVAEQIRVFAGARVIVAAHGAALANLVFAPEGTRIVEISSTNILHMADFRWIAKQLGQRTVTVISEDYVSRPDRPPPANATNWDYRVDVRRVLAALHEMAPDVR